MNTFCLKQECNFRNTLGSEQKLSQAQKVRVPDFLIALNSFAPTHCEDAERLQYQDLSPFAEHLAFFLGGWGLKFHSLLLFCLVGSLALAARLDCRRPFHFLSLEDGRGSLRAEAMISVAEILDRSFGPDYWGRASARGNPDFFLQNNSDRRASVMWEEAQIYFRRQQRAALKDRIEDDYDPTKPTVAQTPLRKSPTEIRYSNEPSAPRFDQASFIGVHAASQNPTIGAIANNISGPEMGLLVTVLFQKLVEPAYRSGSLDHAKFGIKTVTHPTYGQCEMVYEKTNGKAVFLSAKIPGHEKALPRYQLILPTPYSWDVLAHQQKLVQTDALIVTVEGPPGKDSPRVLEVKALTKDQGRARRETEEKLAPILKREARAAQIKELEHRLAEENKRLKQVLENYVPLENRQQIEAHLEDDGLVALTQLTSFLGSFGLGLWGARSALPHVYPSLGSPWMELVSGALAIVPAFLVSHALYEFRIHIYRRDSPMHQKNLIEAQLQKLNAEATADSRQNNGRLAAAIRDQPALALYKPAAGPLLKFWESHFDSMLPTERNKVLQVLRDAEELHFEPSDLHQLIHTMEQEIAKQSRTTSGYENAVRAATSALETAAIRSPLTIESYSFDSFLKDVAEPSARRTWLSRALFR